MKKLFSILLVLLMTLSLFALTSCAEKETPDTSAEASDSAPAETDATETEAAESADLPKAIFADAGWDSIQFHNAVMMFVAENAYGMETEQISGSTAVTYEAMKSGDITVYSEVWTDNIATYDEDVESGSILEMGLNFDDDMQGLYVPRYVIEGDEERGIEPMAPDLKTVEDLKNYADVFADPDDKSMGRILGAISGWAIDDVMRAKYEYYGLDEMYNYVDPGSDAALAASFAGAYEKGEAIVGYYWEPTYLTGKYDLVLLEDAPYIDDEAFLAGETECPAVPLTVCVNPDFYAAAQEFCDEFCANYSTSSALTAEVVVYIQDSGVDMTEAAIWFMQQHDELIDEWLPADKAELVRAALAE